MRAEYFLLHYKTLIRIQRIKASECHNLNVIQHLYDLETLEE